MVLPVQTARGTLYEEQICFQYSSQGSDSVLRRHPWIIFKINNLNTI